MSNEHSPANHSDGFISEVHTFIPSLRHFVGKKIYNEAACEDIVQQTLLEAHRNWHKFRGDSSPKTWLFGIASNLTKNASVKSYRFDMLFESAEENQFNQASGNDSEDPHSKLQRQQVMDCINQSIRKLPPHMRQVVNEVLIRNQSYEEAAESLGLPVGTVRSRLSRAREQLRASLEHLE